MTPEKKKGASFKRAYLYLFGLGLLLFGMFAMFFRSYDHPYYGRINLGEYHQWIGMVVFILAIAYLRYIKGRC